MKKRICISTLGCRVNQFESNALADAADAAGWEVVSPESPADAAIINSCALTKRAVLKTRRAVAAFLKNNPSASVCVAGCCADVCPGEFSNIPRVKWIIGNSRKADCVKTILENPSPEKPLVLTGARAPSEGAGEFSVCGSSPLSDRTNLKIQDGCDNFCAYCVIPLARGAPRSREIKDILSDARNAVSRGVREIILTGINIAKFAPADGGNLVGLIDELNSLKGLFRLRLGSVEPPNFPLDELLERAADPAHKLMPHLHLSIQSLSDVVLKAMQRRYGVDEILSLLKRARERVPHMFLGCDIICGHPGESEEDYFLTEDRALESPLCNIHVFAFSPRPGTAAALNAASAPPPSRMRFRTEGLRTAAKKLYGKFLETQFGKKRTALLENRLPDGSYIAHTDNYIKLRIGGLPPGMKNALVEAELGDGKTGPLFDLPPGFRVVREGGAIHIDIRTRGRRHTRISPEINGVPPDIRNELLDSWCDWKGDTVFIPPSGVRIIRGSTDI